MRKWLGIYHELTAALGDKAAALVLRSRSEGTPGILGQILNIPVTCHPKCFPVSKYPYLSYTQNVNSPIVDSWKMGWFWSQYLSVREAESASDPIVSPLLANEETLKRSPPARESVVDPSGENHLRNNH